MWYVCGNLSHEKYNRWKKENPTQGISVPCVTAVSVIVRKQAITLLGSKVIEQYKFENYIKSYKNVRYIRENVS